MKEKLGDFKIDGMASRYNVFMPRFYNFCRSLGFERKKIMPSRAFCSDENQGFPIILITKHFGTFPFNHGRVGGIVATDRHGPHAHHGKDMVIIHASHVGYDPDAGNFGSYRRLQTEHNEYTTDCGKIAHVTDWYLKEYDFAKNNIFLHREDDKYLITIDNHLLKKERQAGVFLRLDKIIKPDEDGEYHPLMSLSTSKSFLLVDSFVKSLPDFSWETSKGNPIGDSLAKDMIFFKKAVTGDTEGKDHLETNLLPYMPDIVTSNSPSLTAAVANTQIEFDRSFRTIVKSDDYRGKRLVLISGVNIDISPGEGQIFPLTKFVPWAAYIQNIDDSFYTLEQADIVEQLKGQTTDNPDQIDLEKAMQVMEEAKEIQIRTSV